jgi:hypothetical protein
MIGGPAAAALKLEFLVELPRTLDQLVGLVRPLALNRVDDRGFLGRSRLLPRPDPARGGVRSLRVGPSPGRRARRSRRMAVESDRWTVCEDIGEHGYREQVASVSAIAEGARRVTVRDIARNAIDGDPAVARSHEIGRSPRSRVARGERLADRLDATGGAARLLAVLVGGRPWTGRRDVESGVRGGAESDANDSSGARELIAR